jgi:hypothetical protein
MVPINTLHEEKAIPYIPKFKIEKVMITAKSRKLRANWTFEEPQILECYIPDELVDEIMKTYYDEPKNQFQEVLEYLDIKGYVVTKETWDLYNVEELYTDMKTICGIDPLEDLFIILREEGRLERKLDFLKMIKETV